MLKYYRCKTTRNKIQILHLQYSRADGFRYDHTFPPHKPLLLKTAVALVSQEFCYAREVIAVFRLKGSGGS